MYGIHLNAATLCLFFGQFHDDHRDREFVHGFLYSLAS
jgi:hypothetical protein